MPRYYFDQRDGDEFVEDDQGVELQSDAAAKAEAAIALTEMARDVLPGSIRRVLSIEVRDHNRRPLLSARLTFEIAPLG